MRNVSKKVAGKIDTNFMFNYFFPKIFPFMTHSGKIRKRQTGHRWQIIRRRKDAICMSD